MTNNYLIMLKSGHEFAVTREELPDKSAFGLWKWSFKQQSVVILDFNEFSVVASEVILMKKQGGNL